MRKFGLVLLTTAALMLANIGVAAAQAVCSQRQDVLKQLGAQHKEQPTAMGLTSNGRMIEVLTSESGSWTIIVTHPNGVTCLVAAGEAWEAIERIAMEPSA